MKEKGIAIVVCIITIGVVTYAAVFGFSRAQQLRDVEQTITVQQTQEEPQLQKEQKPVRARKVKRERARYKLSPIKLWMQECLQKGVLENLDHANHTVAMDPAIWRLMSIDEQWVFIECVQTYFDGYATITSSTSGRPLASYDAWHGVRIHG